MGEGRGKKGLGNLRVNVPATRQKDGGIYQGLVTGQKVEQ